MSTGSAFQTSGKSVSVAAGASSASNLLKFTDLGLTQAPQALRIVNNGTVPVWLWISNATQTAVFPVAGANAGTPAFGVLLMPGVIEIFGFNAINVNPNNEQPQNPGFWVNTISSLTAQPIFITGGEGL